MRGAAVPLGASGETVSGSRGHLRSLGAWPLSIFYIQRRRITQTSCLAPSYSRTSVILGGGRGVRGHLPSRGQLTSNHGSISASIPLRQPSAAGFRGAAASESWTALVGRRSAHRARSRKCQESQMKSSLLRVRAVLGVVSNEQTTVFAS